MISLVSMSRMLIKLLCSIPPKFDRIVSDRISYRFNKIATQGAPQMAVDKEANSLSRVYRARN